ncbi:HupE/UreJ family protein [Jannaschia ovalis]|uniref:HupE/UreJ family protein n=1 Tax=Jannaschia ovalis TaxID=3038773 RepID=A0ABY8LDM6_9RHOB|nr:HupE/UreJ family protein [Jannaschia sp. GRR-S6-38]WGH79421.1 HupE/UreJ family protein [Jannaschia sp. GRR-S6-38]
MNRILTAAALTALATPALAHHPLDGMPMESVAHGLLSGAGHPVLGFDHLFFVALMGVAAALCGLLARAPLAYLAAMLGGTALTTLGVALPAQEAMIVLSLIVLGGWLASGRALATAPLLAVFAGFGLFHGAAFGAAVAGQEGGLAAPVFAGYLLGLFAVQYALTFAAGTAARRLAAAGPVNARLAGAMGAGVGLFLALEMVEGPLLAAIAG